MDIDEAIRKGKRAEQLLTDEVLSEAFSDVETALIDTFKSSDPFQMDERENAHAELRALARVRNRLNTYLDGQKMASDRLEKARKRQ